MSVSSGATNGGSASSSTPERARRLHREVLLAAKNENALPTTTQYGEGYHYTGNLAPIMDKLWPSLHSGKNTRRSTARSFIATIKQHLKAHGNLVPSGDGWFVRSEYREGAGRAVVQHPILGTIEDVPEITLLDRAKSVWFRAREYCAQNTRPTRNVEGVVFWEADKPLAYFLKQVWPELTAYEGGRQPIYDFLRSTANAVNVGAKHDDEMIGTAIHSWLIRDEWNEAGGTTVFRTLTREPTAADRREARLSTHEAGEDRPAMPVIITKATQEAVNDMPNSTPANKPTNQQEAANNADSEEVSLKCDHPGCDYVGKNAYALGGHRRSHSNDKDGTMARKTALAVMRDTIDALASKDEEIARLKAEAEEGAQVRQELRNQLAAAENSGDDKARVDLIRDVMTRVQQGALTPFRALGEIEDALS